MKILFRFYGFRERVDKDGHLKNVHLHSRHLILAKVDTMEIKKAILYNKHVYSLYRSSVYYSHFLFWYFNTHDIQIV